MHCCLAPTVLEEEVFRSYDILRDGHSRQAIFAQVSAIRRDYFETRRFTRPSIRASHESVNLCSLFQCSSSFNNKTSRISNM